MILISHRGNIFGPNKKDENKIEYVENALNLGFDVEIDVFQCQMRTVHFAECLGCDNGSLGFFRHTSTRLPKGVGQRLGVNHLNESPESSGFYSPFKAPSRTFTARPFLMYETSMAVDSEVPWATSEPFESTTRHG